MDNEFPCQQQAKILFACQFLRLLIPMLTMEYVFDLEEKLHQ